MKSQQNKLSLGFQLQLKENIGEIGLMVWHRNSNLIKRILDCSHPFSNEQYIINVCKLCDSCSVLAHE